VQVMMGCTKLTTELLWGGEFDAATAAIQKFGVSVGVRLSPHGVKAGSATAQRRADNRKARKLGAIPPGSWGTKK